MELPTLWWLCQLLRWLCGIGCVPRGILWQLEIAVSPKEGCEYFIIYI